MGSKLGFILSLLFISQLFVIVGDLISIQFIYTNLDSVSVTAGYVISQKGMITNEVVELVSEQAGASIVQIGDASPIMGEIFKYKIAKNYNPLTIGNGPMEIAIVRSIVIGYYS